MDINRAYGDLKKRIEDNITKIDKASTVDKENTPVFSYNVVFDKKLEEEIDKELKKMKFDKKKVQGEKEQMLQAYQEEYEKFEREKEKQIKAKIEKENIKKALRKLDQDKIEILKKQKEDKMKALETEKERLINAERKTKANLECINDKINYLQNVFDKEQRTLEEKRNEVERRRDEILGQTDHHLANPEHLPKKLRLVAANGETQGFYRAKLEMLQNQKAELQKQVNEFNYKKEFFTQKHETIFKPTKVVDLYDNYNYIELKNKISSGTDTLDHYVTTKQKELKLKELESLRLKRKLLEMESEGVDMDN